MSTVAVTICQTPLSGRPRDLRRLAPLNVELTSMASGTLEGRRPPRGARSTSGNSPMWEIEDRSAPRPSRPTKPGFGKELCPHLLRSTMITRPKRVQVVDVTCIPIARLRIAPMTFPSAACQYDTRPSDCLAEHVFPGLRARLCFPFFCFGHDGEPLLDRRTSLYGIEPPLEIRIGV